MRIVREDRFPIQTEHDIVLSRQAVRLATVEAGFGLVDQTKMITAASELARNTVVYGGGGEMQLWLLHDGMRKGVKLAFSDRGPGIPDLDQALVDGWTSGSGLGLGLSGSRRLVNDFDVKTAPGEGTTVTIARWK